MCFLFFISIIMKMIQMCFGEVNCIIEKIMQLRRFGDIFLFLHSSWLTFCQTDRWCGFSGKKKDLTRCCEHFFEILVHIDITASHSCCWFLSCTSRIQIRSTTSQRVQTVWDLSLLRSCWTQQSENGNTIIIYDVTRSIHLLKCVKKYLHYYSTASSGSSSLNFNTGQVGLMFACCFHVAQFWP